MAKSAVTATGWLESVCTHLTHSRAPSGPPNLGFTVTGFDWRRRKTQLEWGSRWPQERRFSPFNGLVFPHLAPLGSEGPLCWSSHLRWPAIPGAGHEDSALSLSQAQLFGRARQAAQGPRLGLCVALPPAPWGSYPLLFPVSIWALWAVGPGRVTRINTK